MKLDKLDKKDKRLIIIGIIVAVIGQLFIEKALDIVFILETMYFIHKYLYNAEKYESLTDYDIVYINKEKYYKSMKKFIQILDMYLVIRLIILLFTEVSGFTVIDIILVAEVLIVYRIYLERKYIKSIDGVEVARGRNLFNNKILTTVLFVIFMAYSYTHISNLTINEKEISLSKYSYSLTHDENNKVVELKLKDDFYQRGEYNEKSAPYINKYIQYGKQLVSINIIKDYSFIAMIFMFILTFIQLDFKDKRRNSVTGWVFLILALVFASIWSINTYNFENKVTSYFAQYIGS